MNSLPPIQKVYSSEYSHSYSSPITTELQAISSDEYRLLRQNLFERFATQTPFPTENPVVPATGPPRTTDKNGPCFFFPFPALSLILTSPSASLHNQQSH